MRVTGESSLKELCEVLAVKQLQVVLSEVLRASEEGIFRFRKLAGVFEVKPSQLKGAGNVSGLEQAISRRLYIGDKFGRGRKKRERLFQERSQLALSVVIIDLDLVKCGQCGFVVEKKANDLAKQGIVNALGIANEVLVNFETVVRNVCLVHEKEHAAEDASPLFPAHCRVFFFAANQRTGVNAMIAGKSHVLKGCFKSGNLVFDADVLIVKDHADEIVPRRATIRIVAPGFVHENANLFNVHNDVRNDKTKARISPRLRQETFPLAGDAGFRPCRGIFYHNRICRRKGLISSRG